MPGPSLSKPSVNSTRSTDRGEIRAFTRADVDEVADLWMRCFRHAEAAAPTALRRYFAEVLLDHPWYDPTLAPLVLEQQGEIAGFIGRMARPMRFEGKPIRCAVITQLMVDPRKKLGFAAIELLRAVLGGPQDLCFSDGANESSARLWQRCGGRASRLLSFEWARPLRPMQSLALRMAERPRLAGLARVVSPMAGIVDAGAVRMLPRVFHKPRAGLLRRVATPEQILPLMQQVSSAMSLSPEYTEDTYKWLLRTVGEAQAFGPMRSVMASDNDGQAIGWFVYFVQRGGVARVLQMGACGADARPVIAELLQDAWEQGAVVVSGSLDPAMMSAISNSHASYSCKDMGVLVHAGDPTLLAAIERGDAYLSRLEGEWWMRFGIDRAAW